LSSFFEAVHVSDAGDTMSSMKSFTAMLLMIVPLVGCIADLQRDVSSLKREMRAVREYQADNKSQLASLTAELREVRGRVEEIEYGSSRSSGRQNKNEDSLRGKLSSSRRTIEPPRIVPQDLLMTDEQEEFSQLLDEAAASRFSESLLFLRESNFSQAVSYLQSALDANSGRSSSAVILFWLGVAYEGSDDKRNALRAYNELIKSFPTSTRAPRALLRQGAIFSEIGDRNAARITYTKLLREYKRSDEVVEAEQRMRSLAK
jgi:TolA-binding protein